MTSKKQRQEFEAVRCIQQNGSLALSDEQLVKRFQTGEREVFGELYQRYQDPVHGMACYYLGNDADAWDAVQNTFTKALANLHKFQEKSSFKTWLWTIAYNATMTLARKNSRQREDFPVSRPAEDTRTPDDILLHREALTLIRIFLHEYATLPMQSVYILLYQEDLSLSEIAAILETTKGKIDHEKRRLIGELKEYLSRRGWSVD